MDKKPLISIGDRDAFGSAREQDSFYDLDQQAQDVTWIPGYSDKRRQNTFADTEQGRQAGVKKVRIENRMHLARTQTPSGKPDSRDVTSRINQGYRYVTKENIASLGIEAPPSAQLDAAGHYVIGDTVLMYCPRDVAARNENVLRRATDERSSVGATSQKFDHDMSQTAGQGGLTEASVSHKTEVRRK